MTGIAIAGYRRLLAHLDWTALDPSPELMDRIQQLAVVPEPVLRQLEVDTRGVFPLGTPVEERAGADAFFDEWRIGWRRPDRDGLYYDVDASPMPGEPEASGLAGYRMPEGAADRRFGGMDARIGGLDRQGMGIVLNGFTSGAMEMVTRIRGYQEAMVDLALEPERVAYLLDGIVEQKMRYWTRALGIAGGRAQVAVEVDDLGTQQGLLFSRDLYRSILMPRHRRLFEHIHRTSPGIRVFLHSCGAVREVIPDLIEAGVDILNPVQTSAAGMEPVGLKRDFGKDLVFWGGGVDTQRILPFGTPEEVREDVKRRIDTLAPGGGFVFSSIHNVQSDVPPANLAALLETLHTFGKAR
jgi:uroporphyrinogen decarboxylase